LPFIQITKNPKQKIAIFPVFNALLEKQKRAQKYAIRRHSIT